MKYFFPLIILALVWSVGAEAQSRPQIIVSWSSDSYIPNDFEGKPLPSPGSSIKVSLIILDSSIPADLSQKEIRWSLNGEALRSGAGLQSLDFKAPNTPGEFLKVRAQLPDFKGEFISKTIDIPIVRPEAVISTDFSGNEFSKNNLDLKARAFFFNVQNQDLLSFSWKVNRQDPNPSSEPDRLLLSLPNIRDGYKAQVVLKIDNESPAESASVTRNFIYRR